MNFNAFVLVIAAILRFLRFKVMSQLRAVCVLYSPKQAK